MNEDLQVNEEIEVLYQDVEEVNENVIVYEINTPDYSSYLNSINENLSSIDTNTTTVIQYVYSNNDYYTRSLALQEFNTIQLFSITILLIILIFRGVKK